MNKTIRLFSALLAICLLVTACNLPSNAPKTQDLNAASTAAAQTVQVQLTLMAPPTAASTPIPTIPTTTAPPPTFAPPPVPPTPTSICDAAYFVTDVTYPDGSIVAPGAAITKTWRLKNVGTCSWTPSYTVVFSSGDSMNGPSAQALEGNVNPGQTVDISVDLTAPSTPGDYKGYWKLRNAAGVLFAQFYIQIKVQNPATPTNTPPTPTTVTQVTLTSVSSEDGYVSSDGIVNPNPNVGDNSSNQTLEAFLSFDMTPIPAGAVITKVVVDFSAYDILGDPFTISDGCLRAYVQDYGGLDSGDFFPGDPTNAILRWCGTAELSSVTENASMISVVQSKVGSTRLQMRLQFRVPTTNGNGVEDVVRFGNVKLIVSYHLN
ncbi:MAG: NBR1-Ig-like domain-containing protein [Acidithiobacillus sp.]|nr:NBR1-Ig-like domain-containing protein [Acidithiobacillus sp.]